MCHLFTFDSQVFEPFGPVLKPLYSVRFNSPEEIESRMIKPGMEVYYAPDAPQFTHYVFMEQLRRYVYEFFFCLYSSIV